MLKNSKYLVATNVVFNDTSEFKDDQLMILVTNNLPNVNDRKYKKNVAFHRSSLFNNKSDEIYKRHNVQAIL